MACAAVKLIDAVLFLFFLMMAIVAPLFDAQSALPLEYYPKKLVELNSWYGTEYGDYLTVEKPHFFVGLVWLELVFTWPLSIACLVGLVSGKPWFSTTCLIYGVTTITSMTAIMAELLGSGRASDTMLKIYAPFMGLGALAFLRGLIPCIGCTSTTSTTTSTTSNGTAAFGKRPVVARKKKA